MSREPLPTPAPPRAQWTLATLSGGGQGSGAGSPRGMLEFRHSEGASSRLESGQQGREPAEDGESQGQQRRPPALWRASPNLEKQAPSSHLIGNGSIGILELAIKSVKQMHLSLTLPKEKQNYSIDQEEYHRPTHSC